MEAGKEEGERGLSGEGGVMVASTLTAQTRVRLGSPFPAGTKLNRPNLVSTRQSRSTSKRPSLSLFSTVELFIQSVPFFSLTAM